MPPKRKSAEYQVPEFIACSLSLLKPPEKLTVSQWAEKYRILDSKSSAMPGRWNNNITPYLTGIMDEFNNPDTEEIVFIKPTQVGGTEALQNMVGYIVCQDPSAAMIVYPTDKLAESVSENRLQPVFTNSPQISQRFYEKDSKLLELQFEGMYLSLAGANSPSSLASKPIRYLFMDEVDKYPGASKKEADPIALARERTKTFSNRKIFVTSTPTLKTGHIWQALEGAHIVKHFKVPCPHCSDFIEFKWSNVKFSDDTTLSPADRAAGAYYVCQSCGCMITDNQKAQMLRLGKWVIVSRKADVPTKVAYWINTIYSPFVRFSEMAEEWLSSQGDPEKLQNFVNSWLAEPWEDTKVKADAQTVIDKQTENPEYEVPDWAQMLTGGVDVQETCAYWSIYAWGPGLTSHNIAHGVSMSLDDVDLIMNREYKKRDGTSMLVCLGLVDSGDQTDEVYDFCYSHSDWAMPCKGASTPLGYFRLSTVNKPGARVNGIPLVLVDGGRYKDMINNRLRKEKGPGSLTVHAGCDQDFAEQMTNEHKVTERKGKVVAQVWVPKTSHAPNHFLDSSVYAFAAADLRGVRAIVEPVDTPEPASKKENKESWLGDLKERFKS